MGRKQIVVLEALSKARKPLTLQDLADKNLKGDGRDEVYGASDLRSTFRRLSGRKYITLSKVTVGEGDKAKEVDAATITDAGKAALKEAKNPTPKSSGKGKDSGKDSGKDEGGSEAPAEAPAEDPAPVV